MPENAATARRTAAMVNLRGRLTPSNLRGHDGWLGLDDRLGLEGPAPLLARPEPARPVPDRPRHQERHERSAGEEVAGDERIDADPDQQREPQRRAGHHERTPGHGYAAEHPTVRRRGPHLG